MAISLTSIGVKVSYAFESVAGTRPSTGYKLIPQVKEIPEMNPQPETLETTSFDNIEYKTYVDGLKDLGGVIDFTANFTQELYDLWQATSTGIMAQWATARAVGKAMYICIDIPGLDKSCYLSVIPSNLGLPAASVNTVMETTLHFTPVGEPIWDTDPIYESATTYNVTFTGYVSTGVTISVLEGTALVAEFETEDTSTIIKLPNGNYTAIARKSGKTTQVKDAVVNDAAVTVTFSTFA